MTFDPCITANWRRVRSRLSIIAASALLLLSIALPVTARAQASHGKDLTVEIEGTLPGFTPEQLSAYVAQQMDAADIAEWHFAPAPIAKTGTSEPANRVVWHFKLLPYGGGSVRYIGPILSKTKAIFGVGRAIGIDAKIYLDGKYQATSFDQATIKGGPNDPGLAIVIQKLTRSIVSNALATEPGQGPKLASVASTKIG